MMKIYKLNWNYDHLIDIEEDASHISFHGESDFRFYVKGIEMIKAPHTIFFYSNFNIIPNCSDFPIVDLCIPVLSRKMLKILISLGLKNYHKINAFMIDDTYHEKLFNNKGDLLKDVPVCKDYFILQLLEYTDCFDYENSIFHPLRSNPSKPGIIEKIILNLPKKGFPPIFRIPEKPSDLFITQQTKDAFENKGIQGCTYETIEESIDI